MGKQRHAPQEEYNPRLRALMLQVVDNQIAGRDESGKPITTTVTEDPDYVKHTFERLSVVHGPELPKGTEELLRSYFDAFANLYGITPLYRAFRIIQK